MRVVAPVNMEQMASPANTMPSGDTCRNLLRPKITKATAIEPTRAHRGIPKRSAAPILNAAEKNRLWKLVLQKATVYRTPDGELSVHIYPNLPR